MCGNYPNGLPGQRVYSVFNKRATDCVRSMVLNRSVKLCEGLRGNLTVDK